VGIHSWLARRPQILTRKMKYYFRSRVVAGIADPGSRHHRCRLQVIGAALIFFPLIASAKLNVVATLPDFGAVAREIGGDKVAVTVLAKPTEDSHFVDARRKVTRKSRTCWLAIFCS
jgi:hypothetical protein